MKAALFFKETKELQVKDIEEPKIENGEALLEVKGVGLCGTDLKIYRGILEIPFSPFIMGHEIAGKVIESMPSNKVEKDLIQEINNKNLVIVYIYIGCGICEACRLGEFNACDKVKRIGFEVNGGFSQYVKVPILNLLPLPKNIGYEAAILADAGASVYHALKKIHLDPTKWSLVMGIGGLGSIAIQLLKLYGCNVIAMDKIDDKLKYAEELGADVCINTLSLNKVEIIEKLKNYKINVFIDLVGNEFSQDLAIRLLSKKGYYLQIGYSDSTYSKIKIKDLVYKEINIVGSLGNSIHDLMDIIYLASKNKIKLNITDRFKLEEITNALEKLERNEIKGRALILL